MKSLEALILLLTFTYGLTNPTKVESNKEVTNYDESEEGNDPTIVFSETINSATKLLYDLDAHVQQFVPAENAVPSDEVAQTAQTAPTTTQDLATSEPQIYSALNSEFDLALSKQEQSVGALVTQLDTLQKRIQDTVTELTSRRRYILSAMLRPMLNSVRRIRSNVVRIQTQLTSIQTAATSVGSRPGAQTLGAADQSAIDSIRRRVDDIQKRIGDIIGRISTSLNIPGGSASAVKPPNSQSSSSGAPGR